MNSVIFKRLIKKSVKKLTDKKRSCDVCNFKVANVPLKLGFIFIEDQGGTLYCQQDDCQVPLCSYTEKDGAFLNPEDFKRMEPALMRLEEDHSLFSTLCEAL